ncbi:MAG: methylated-DNA--[protein]-cysteine S-methyltransferase [Rikenellaceae bacterium]
MNNPFTDLVASQLQEYFDGARTHFTFKFELQGTKFQQKVWRALCTIPYAERRTYKDIAIEIGSPLASRAVGMACNRNPMMIVVPCHRVVGSNGRLVGYAGGIDLKEKLLSIESDRGSIYPAPLSQIQSL